MKEKLITFLKEKTKRNLTSKVDAETWIFINLIQMMKKDHIEGVFENYFLSDNEFDDGFYKFHKSMRQIDFYSYDELEGSLDMIFWEFIQLSEIPYLMLKEFTEKIKKNENA